VRNAKSGLEYRVKLFGVQRKDYVKIVKAIEIIDFVSVVM